MSAFKSFLVGEFLADGRNMLLRLPLVFESDVLSREIIVPAGSETDFATYLRPLGKWTRPVVVHDFLYRTPTVTRREADAVFLEAMAAEGVSASRRYAFWLAVRAFGWAAWRKHQ